LILTDLRLRIDAVDKELVALLNKRAQIALEIFKHKKEVGLPELDIAREKDIYAKIFRLNAGPLSNQSLSFIFTALMMGCLNAEHIHLWLDDIRDPENFGFPGWLWVKTAEEAIAVFKTRRVEEASLDHDLTPDQMCRGGILGEIHEDGQKSGYDVVRWLEEHPEFWPPKKVQVHSANPAGSARMRQVIDKFYDKDK